MSEIKTSLERLEIGAAVYAIDDNRQVVKGTLSARWGSFIEIQTEHGPRVFDARHVTFDLWRGFEELP